MLKHFQICLRSGPKGADPPPYGEPDKKHCFWETSLNNSEECISSILPTKLTTTNPSDSEQTVQNLLASTHNCRRYSSTGNNPLPIQLCNFPSPFLWFEPPFEATMVSATNINLNMKYIIYPSNKVCDSDFYLDPW